MRPLWHKWYRFVQATLNKLEPRMVSMLADVADQRPTAQQLLQHFFQQPSYPSLQSPQIQQTKGKTMIYSAGPSTMDWTRTRATELRRRNSRPVQQDDDAQSLEPNPLQEVSDRPMQLRSGYKLPHTPKSVKSARSVRSVKSTKSTNDKRVAGGQHNKRPPRRGRYAPSHPGGVLKRTSTRISRRSRAESVLKAEEMRALGVT
jgi:hypothetical protein